jgi:Uma2 family endonuclease
MNPVAIAQQMKADEFCEWAQRPENANRWFELVRGEVIELPPRLKSHGVICSNVSRLVGNFAFDQGKGYVAGNDSGVILARDPDTVRGPDVAYYEDADTFSELHPKYSLPATASAASPKSSTITSTTACRSSG